jgi:hypothetical protein
VICLEFWPLLDVAPFTSISFPHLVFRVYCGGSNSGHTSTLLEGLFSFKPETFQHSLSHTHLRFLLNPIICTITIRYFIIPAQPIRYRLRTLVNTLPLSIAAAIRSDAPNLACFLFSRGAGVYLILQEIVNRPIPLLHSQPCRGLAEVCQSVTQTFTV